MSLARSSFLFSLGTLVSRVTGLLRDTIVASVFGATALLDAFFVANRIPNLFRDMLAEGALGSAFTKVYSSLASEDPKRAQRLFVDALRLTVVLLLIVTALGILLAPLLVNLFTSDPANSARGEEFYFNAVGLTRVLFPFLGFATLAALAMGVLQQRGRFFLAAVSPIALNLGYVIGALVLAKCFSPEMFPWLNKNLASGPIFGLALGVLLGGFAYFAMQFIWVWKDLKGLDWSASKEFLTPDIKKMFVLMAPAAVASSAPILNVVINTNFATALPAGTVTWLNFAFRLLQLPVGLFAVAIGAAVLPSLSRSITLAKGTIDRDASEQIQTSLEFVTWLMMPCTVFLMVNARELVDLFYGYGRFSEHAISQTALALVAYSYGVLGYGMIKVLTSVYFATDRTKFAMTASLLAVGINLAANYAMVHTHGHAGLAAATSISISSNALILLWGLRGRNLQLNGSNLLISLILIFFSFAAALLAQNFCVSYVTGLDLTVILGHEKWQNALIIALNGAIVFAVFIFFALFRLRWSPAYALGQIKSFKARLRQKRSR